MKDRADVCGVPSSMEEDEMYFHSDDELLGEGDSLSQGSLDTR